MRQVLRIGLTQIDLLVDASLRLLVEVLSDLGDVGHGCRLIV